MTQPNFPGYELKCPVRESQSGIEWLAHRKLDGQPVAIQQSRPTHTQASRLNTARPWLETQVSTLSDAQPPGVPAVYGVVDTVDPLLFGLVSAHVEGSTLRNVLREVSLTPPGRLESLLLVFEQAAATLSALHNRGLAHGHLTMDRILLGDGPHRGKVYILDLCWARAGLADTNKEEHAPEIALTNAHIRPGSDQWALAYILKSALGKVPNASVLLGKALSRGLERSLHRTLAARFPRIDQLGQIISGARTELAADPTPSIPQNDSETLLDSLRIAVLPPRLAQPEPDQGVEVPRKPSKPSSPRESHPSEEATVPSLSATYVPQQVHLVPQQVHLGTHKVHRIPLTSERVASQPNVENTIPYGVETPASVANKSPSKSKFWTIVRPLTMACVLGLGLVIQPEPFTRWLRLTTGMISTATPSLPLAPTQFSTNNQSPGDNEPPIRSTETNRDPASAAATSTLRDNPASAANIGQAKNSASARSNRSRRRTLRSNSRAQSTLLTQSSERLMSTEPGETKIRSRALRMSISPELARSSPTESYTGSNYRCGQNSPYLCRWQAKKALGRANLKQARMFFEKACDANDAKSCSDLADMWFNGEGGPVRLRTARAFLHRACMLGHSPSCTSR